MSKQIFEGDIVDIDCYEESRAPFFDKTETRIDGFPICSLVLSNMMRVSEGVWWVCKWTYILLGFVPLIIFSFVTDLALLAISALFGWLKELGKSLISWISPTLAGFGKVIGVALALILIFEFLAHQGFDGLSNLYSELCNFLKSGFAG